MNTSTNSSVATTTLDSTLTIWPSPQLISYTRRPSWMNRWMNSSEPLAEKRTLPSVVDVFIVMKRLFDEEDDQSRDAYSRNELPLNDGKCTARSVEGQWNDIEEDCTEMFLESKNSEMLLTWNVRIKFLSVPINDIIITAYVSLLSSTKMLTHSVCQNHYHVWVFVTFTKIILSFQTLQIIRWARNTCSFLYLSRDSQFLSYASINK